MFKSLLGGVLLAHTLIAQSVLQFEVASIRPSAQDNQRVDVGLHLDGAQARIASLSLRDYVGMAYRVRSYQVSGPDWIANERFDINATMPAGSKLDQIPEMMQALLAERFGLKFHRVQKEFPVYLLARGKRPLALRESSVDAAATPGAVTVSGSGSSAGVSVNLGGGASYTFANNKFEGKKLNMATLTDSLSAYMDLPVIDGTGLNGFYDFTLDITAEDYRSMLIRAAVANGVVLPPQALRLLETATTPSLFDAINNVGLSLEAKKMPLDVIVIDAVARTPTEN